MLALSCVAKGVQHRGAAVPFREGTQTHPLPDEDIRPGGRVGQVPLLVLHE